MDCYVYLKEVEELGAKEALILGQIRTYLNYFSEKINNEYWINESEHSIAFSFKFWSNESVERIIQKLVRKGVLESMWH